MYILFVSHLQTLMTLNFHRRTAVANLCAGLLCDFRSVEHRAWRCLSQRGRPSPVEGGEKAFPGSAHPALRCPYTISALAAPNQVCTPAATGSSLPGGHACCLRTPRFRKRPPGREPRLRPPQSKAASLSGQVLISSLSRHVRKPPTSRVMTRPSTGPPSTPPRAQSVVRPRC